MKKVLTNRVVLNTFIMTLFIFSLEMIIRNFAGSKLFDFGTIRILLASFICGLGISFITHFFKKLPARIIHIVFVLAIGLYEFIEFGLFNFIGFFMGVGNTEQGTKVISYILDFLKRESDEEHPVTAADICEYLDSQGIAAERKSVYADISALTDYGADIVRSGSPRGWSLASREFEEPEIYLLADAVRTAGFISAAKTRELVKKLDSFVSRYQAQKRENRVYFSSCAKSVNEEIFYSIDKISRAVSEKKKIRFEYVNRVLSPDRTIEKQKREMLISPYALTWQDDHYYVIGNYEKYDNLIHLRLDRMYKVEITDMPQRHFSEVSEYTDYFVTPDYTGRGLLLYRSRCAFRRTGFVGHKLRRQGKGIRAANTA